MRLRRSTSSTLSRPARTGSAKALQNGSAFTCAPHAGSLRAGQRSAAVMSLIQSAKLNEHDPYANLKDVLTRLPTRKASGSL